ncbi:MAG: DUF4405 domain-containing protein [Planctomycetes bacterium]|jgi:cell division protein FtsW (lipid II flippase)|nr:DUF4405 domain-containing protein [Planctomycetota bacterium]
MSDDPRTGLQHWLDRGINLGMLWGGSLLAGSGLVMEYRLGPDQPRGLTVWGLGWQGWALLHLCLGLTMLALLSLHLWRHRRWWWAVLCDRRRWALLAVAVVALALLLGPLVSSRSG